MLRHRLDLPMTGQDFSEHLQEYPPYNCYEYKYVNESLVLRNKCNRQVLCMGDIQKYKHRNKWYTCIPLTCEGLNCLRAQQRARVHTVIKHRAA
jgi:hypothetical protein